MLAAWLLCLAPQASALPATVPPAQSTTDPSNSEPFDAEDLRAAGQVIGLEFTDKELGPLLVDVRAQLDEIQALRSRELPNVLAPALIFNPVLPGMRLRPRAQGGRRALLREEVQRPADLEDLAFADWPR